MSSSKPPRTGWRGWLIGNYAKEMAEENDNSPPLAIFEQDKKEGATAGARKAGWIGAIVAGILGIFPSILCFYAFILCWPFLAFFGAIAGGWIASKLANRLDVFKAGVLGGILGPIAAVIGGILLLLFFLYGDSR